MEPTMNLTPFLNENTLFLVLKGMFVVGFGLYLAFAGVVMAQIKQMIRTLNGNLDLPLRVLGWAHFIIAGAALLLAFVIL